MNLKRLFATCLCSTLLMAGCGGLDFYEADLEAIFEDYQGNDVPGAAVLVIKNGNTEFEGLYGMANIEAGESISAHTNFRLASVTKQFTAMGILILVERGELSLETGLGSIFSDLPSFAQSISIRNLLRHNAGLLDYESLIPSSFEGQVHDSDVLNLMRQTDSTYFEPGTAYRYSNSGYAVLAMIIEEVSGMSYPDFMRQNIFQPLKMDNTVAFIDGVTSVQNRAYGYTVEATSVTFDDQSQTSAVLGDGGIYSSISDLYKWDQALYSEDLVSSEMLEQAFTPGLASYGFGWRIDSFRSHRRLSHTGSTRGFRTVIQRYPDNKVSVVILTNRNGPAVAALAEELSKHFLD